jgi:uncharacterized protein YecT (DUF1311 family)
MKLAILPVVLVIALSGRAAAQHMNAKDAPCQAVGFGAEETRCFLDEARRADQELNALYTKIHDVLSSSEQGQLQAAQRLWIHFRDANCAAERSLYNGGSAAPMVYAACLGAETRQRAADLNVMYGWRLEKFAK